MEFRVCFAIMGHLNCDLNFPLEDKRMLFIVPLCCGNITPVSCEKLVMNNCILCFKEELIFIDILIFVVQVYLHVTMGFIIVMVSFFHVLLVVCSVFFGVSLLSLSFVFYDSSCCKMSNQEIPFHGCRQWIMEFTSSGSTITLGY